MFLIRDWNQPDEYNFGLEGGKNFLKMFLKVKNFHTPELKQLREYLQNTFEDISCFLMPYPGKTVARNSSFDGRYSDIDEEFVDTMKELFPLILAPENLVLKKINGMPVKSFELSVYIKQYVDLFKSENLPEAKSIYDATLDNQYQILLSKAVDLYLNLISSFQDRIESKSQVDETHKVGKGMALQYFSEQKKFGKPEEMLAYKKELEEKLEKALAEWKPIKLEFLEKIEKEQAKADDQKSLASDAKNRQASAAQDAKAVEVKYVQLQNQISQIRSDTQESRREAEILKQRLARVENERQNALLREQEAQNYVVEMQKKLEFFESQLAIERQKASSKVKERVTEVRKRDGVLQWFGDLISGFLYLSQLPFL